MHDNVPRRRNLRFCRHSSREAAGKTHHCLVGTQSTNISKITVSFTLIRTPTHAFFVSPPGPCLLPPSGWRTQIRRLHTPRTSTAFFTCAHAAISTSEVSHDRGWREECACTGRDSWGRCAVAPGSARSLSKITQLKCLDVTGNRGYYSQPGYHILGPFLITYLRRFDYEVCGKLTFTIIMRWHQNRVDDSPIGRDREGTKIICCIR